MDRKITIIDDSTAEYEEKRSRFIATVRHCTTEAEATAFIAEMRSKYWDARHNVFAYSVDGGALARFSDDGEPHGTAGKPMLEIINASGITDVCAVVTRYFGGVLLGTGGLLRAYSTALKSALTNAQLYEMVQMTVLSVGCEYSLHKKLEYLIENSGGNITDTVFSDTVEVVFSISDDLVADFNEKLCETFSSKLVSSEIKKEILPRKI